MSADGHNKKSQMGRLVGRNVDWRIIGRYQPGGIRLCRFQTETFNHKKIGVFVGADYRALPTILQEAKLRSHSLSTSLKSTQKPNFCLLKFAVVFSIRVNFFC